MEIYNPPHPGLVLNEFLEGISLSEASKRLNMSEMDLNQILNGQEPINVEIAMRLSILLKTSIDLWINMQNTYDLWQVKQKNYDFVIPLSEPLPI